jgi:hypothetical protein
MSRTRILQKNRFFIFFYLFRWMVKMELGRFHQRPLDHSKTAVDAVIERFQFWLVTLYIAYMRLITYEKRIRE